MVMMLKMCTPPLLDVFCRPLKTFRCLLLLGMSTFFMLTRRPGSSAKVASDDVIHVKAVKVNQSEFK
jgi:hypothetical protein